MHKQRLPQYIRRPLQISLWPFIHLDLFMQRLARLGIRPPYKRVGVCKGRGTCCHTVLIKKEKGLLGTLFTLWHTEVNGFYKKQEQPIKTEQGQFHVMGCRYLKKDGSCSNYPFRPEVCRKWPDVERFGEPKILKGCGFSAIPRGARRER